MSRSKEAKVALYREMYGGAPACGESALVVPPINFQNGARTAPYDWSVLFGVRRSIAAKAILSADFGKVEVRVAAMRSENPETFDADFSVVAEEAQENTHE